MALAADLPWPLAVPTIAELLVLGQVLANLEVALVCNLSTRKRQKI
jgi:hypothetical protein